MYGNNRIVYRMCSPKIQLHTVVHVAAACKTNTSPNTSAFSHLFYSSKNIYINVIQGAWKRILVVHIGSRIYCHGTVCCCNRLLIWRDGYTILLFWLYTSSWNYFKLPTLGYHVIGNPARFVFRKKIYFV